MHLYFSVNEFPNILAANIPNNIEKNPIFYFLIMFLIVSLIPFIENPHCSSHLTMLPHFPFFRFFNAVVVNR